MTCGVGEFSRDFARAVIIALTVNTLAWAFALAGFFAVEADAVPMASQFLSKAPFSDLVTGADIHGPFNGQVPVVATMNNGKQVGWMDR